MVFFMFNLCKFYDLLARNTQTINEYINLIKDEQTRTKTWTKICKVDF